MALPLSDSQRRDIRVVLDGVDVGPSELLVAIDAATGERLTRRGRVEPAHQACADADPRHRPRRARWACERHGLFGEVLVAGDRVGILMVSFDPQSERALSELCGATREIAHILGGPDDATSVLVAPVGGGGPHAGALTIGSLGELVRKKADPTC